MREYKFRAWYKPLKKMVKVGQITFEKGTWNCEPDNREYVGVCIPYQPSFILMQYTGMKDINGTEIYEGDIVAEEGHYVNSDRLVYQKIQWKDNYACWLRGEYQRLTPKNIERYKIVVVGNIYDNPELLKEEL